MRLHVAHAKQRIDVNGSWHFLEFLNDPAFELTGPQRKLERGSADDELRHAWMSCDHLPRRERVERHPVIHEIVEPPDRAVGDGATKQDEARIAGVVLQDACTPVVGMLAMVLGEGDQIG